MYIKYRLFGRVGFYGISTIVDLGYLMLNPLYTYILEIYMICEDILLMADNASFNNNIQDNITTNITCVNEATKIKMKEIQVKN